MLAPAPIAADNWERIQDRVVTRAKRKPLAENETRNCPPLRGQTYRGPWPPKGLVASMPRCAKGPTFELDSAQKAWLERYSENTPTLAIRVNC
jgi:hypothetical protein